MSIVDAFNRGNDSVLNRDSSAERRFAEMLAIITGAEITRQTLFKKFDLDVNLGAVLSLPAQVVSATIQELIPDIPNVPGPLRRALAETPVGQLAQGDLVGAALAGTPLGPILAAKAALSGGGTTASVNPIAAGIPPETFKDVKIDPYSIVMIAISTGYVLEKGAGLSGAFGQNLGAALAAADPVIPG